MITFQIIILYYISTRLFLFFKTLWNIETSTKVYKLLPISQRKNLVIFSTILANMINIIPIIGEILILFTPSDIWLYSKSTPKDCPVQLRRYSMYYRLLATGLSHQYLNENIKDIEKIYNERIENRSINQGYN